MSRASLNAWPALALALLAACATAPSPPVAVAPLAAVRAPSSLEQLPGWGEENFAAAFGVVQLACQHAAPATRACREALNAGRLGSVAARAFLTNHFRAEPVAGAGLLTAYFSPVYQARRASGPEFSAPVRPRPADPGRAGDRAAIETAPAADALAWMRPEDLFFLQVQGSGVLVFADGARRRATFAGSNGAPFLAISAPMAARGLLAGDTSAGAVHAWLAAHRGAPANAIMDLDRRYVFFRLGPDDGAGPVGSAGVPLVAGRSLAVDPGRHAYFELLWIDADEPGLAGSRRTYRRLAAALDSGGAIKGEARADLYLGQGAAAGDEAGRVRHALRLWRVVPIDR